MKKLLIVLAVFMLLTACGNKHKEETPAQNNTSHNKGYQNSSKSHHINLPSMPYRKDTNEAYSFYGTGMEVFSPANRKFVKLIP